MTKMKSMNSLKASTIAALAYCALCGAGQAQPASVIAGTWVLQSIYEENDGGEDLDRWGARPTGRFIADASGHFSFQLIGRNPVRVASNASSPACTAQADREVLAYAGKYVLDPEQSIVKLQIDDATSSAWDRNHPTLSLTLRGDRMDFVSSVETSPTGAFYTRLVWKRAN